MLVKADRVAATVMLGVHGRRRAGPGENFWAYREYSFGDSTQRIDWHRSAKLDRVFIRENEWEAANTLWLWSNAGPRMDFKSHLATETKHQRAQLLQLALASLAIRAHERIGTLGNHRRANTGQIALRQMADDCINANDNPLPLATVIQRRSTAVLISDFLDEPDIIKNTLAALAESGMRGHLVQIADPAEETLPYQGRVDFLGLDVAEKFRANKTENLRERYISAYQLHRDQLRQMANRFGWSFTVHRTDQSAAQCLQALYLRVSDR